MSARTFIRENAPDIKPNPSPTNEQQHNEEFIYFRNLYNINTPVERRQVSVD